MPSSCMNQTAASRLVSATCTTASSGRPTLPSASRRQPTMAALESTALDEPRSMMALPAFRHSPAASLVTLGRFS